ncbi:MAG: DUF4364 family protein [Ruminococcus flavefaciens]
MQDENIKKMAEMADTEIRDVPTLNILLCYLLYKIDKPVETEQLYEIAIGTGVVNYFYYQDSIDYLIRNELVSVHKDAEGVDCYIIEPKGVACAKQLKTYAPKSYRDKLVLAALRYFARRKYEKELKIEYIPAGKGYYTQIRVLDTNCDLMDLKLYAPDLTQAKLIGEKVLLNPSGFYSKVIELALSNEEPPYDLSDN